MLEGKIMCDREPVQSTFKISGVLYNAGLLQQITERANLKVVLLTQQSFISSF